MKLNIKSFFPVFLSLFPFIICALISLLYACDLIRTGLFDALCTVNGCLLYVLLGVLLCHIMKKRQFMIALSLSILWMIMAFIVHDKLTDCLNILLKLVFLNATVLFYQLRKPQ